MPKLLVLTDAETAIGYRLAGVEVRESVPEDAVHALEEIIHDDAYGLVVVDEGLIHDPVKVSERAMRGRDLPVLLSVPSLGAAFGAGDDAVTYIKDLVRSAIGFDIKLE
ncbi:MAG: V-type ATP synthase subunit F [Trueperaceae bacterium]|jgi:V/A-type H+-transporting ATPase subunit F|nr:V-type ATP synthase subunit F [Truepera sp.]HRN18025.1 V-type ATP synthase subunit F [Trueperaceae bacterium]HRQ10390.1 V-type ATP synthase subunit F [Trueperaceae bacterium]